MNDDVWTGSPEGDREIESCDADGTRAFLELPKTNAGFKDEIKDLTDKMIDLTEKVAYLKRRLSVLESRD